MSDALELVLGKLDGVRPQGGYWMARCPAPDHDDREASLSVARGTEQPVIVKCHAGCELDAILAGLGLHPADISRPREAPQENQPIAAYPYTDEAGELLYEVLRKPGKRFIQRRPDGRGGWLWSLGSTRRVLYRLPAVIAAAAAGETIYVAEGEKDVHALEAAGVTATCNSGGAGKWRPEFASVLTGAAVIVIADKDDPGIEHARQVAASLRFAGAASVDVRQAVTGKDAADHLQAGHAVAEFVAVSASAAASLGTKKEERSKPARPSMPAADPAMFAGVLGDITGAAAPTTEADPVGIYASLLAGVGVIIDRGPYVRVGNTRHPLLVWPLLLGRTGSGRKGEATSTAEIFLRRAAPSSAAFTVGGLSSGEGLIERIRDQETAAGDDSGDGFTGPGSKQLLVIEPEFTSVMARSKREGSTLAAVQRQAWDGRALTVLNRKALRASASHVAIIGHITPQEFRLRLAEADMTGGTYNRYLPLFVERSRRLPIPEGVNEQTEADLSARLAEGVEKARTVKQIQLDYDATKLWTAELYDELTAGDDEDRAEAEFTRRAAPYCLRVAGLLAALDGRALIGGPDLESAAALIRYSIASARYVLDRQARDPRLDKIRRAVDAAGEGGLSRTEVSALFSRNLTRAVLEELLAELTADDEYEESQTATRGRPAQTYRRVLSSSFVREVSQ